MRQKLTPEQRRSGGERAHRLGRGGDRVIAEEFGVQPATVARWRKQLGLRHEPRRVVPAAATLKPRPVTDGEAPGPKFLSPTGADTYRQCPRRWKMRYIDRLPDPPSREAAAGTFAHLVLQRLLARDAASRTIETAREIARAEWDDFAAGDGYRSLDLSVTEAREFRWRAWQAIEGLWQHEDPSEVEVVATEREVSATIGGVPFKGIVDRVERVDGELVVTDYKSGRPPPRGFGGKHVEQVLLYAAALEAAGEPVQRVSVMYLGQRRRTVPATGQAATSAVQRLAETWTEISEAIDADRFDPKTSPLCGWCPYVELCPEGTAHTESYQQAA